MLMAWGPFRFTVPNYSFEELDRTMSHRVVSQDVIGARPPTHRLGPGEETITLESTFHPHHLNGGGLAQLTGIRETIAAGTPLMLVHASGRNFGRWVGRDINDRQSVFSPQDKLPQVVTASLVLVYYVGGLGGAVGPGGVGGGLFSLNLSVGPVSISLGF